MKNSLLVSILTLGLSLFLSGCNAPIKSYQVKVNSSLGKDTVRFLQTSEYGLYLVKFYILNGKDVSHQNIGGVVVRIPESGRDVIHKATMTAINDKGETLSGKALSTTYGHIVNGRFYHVTSLNQFIDEPFASKFLSFAKRSNHITLKINYTSCDKIGGKLYNCINGNWDEEIIKEDLIHLRSKGFVGQDGTIKNSNLSEIISCENCRVVHIDGI